MAAWELTSRGLNVLLVEAGTKVNTTEVLHSMEWPYDHPRRDRCRRSSTRCRGTNTTSATPHAQDSKYEKVFSYVQGWGGPTIRRRSSWTRRTTRIRHELRVGSAHALGGKTNIWGRLALRLSDYDFKGKSHDGHGEDWPISYADVAPYYDKVDLLLGISGVKENLPQLPDGKFQRPYKLTPSKCSSGTRCRRWAARPPRIAPA